MHSTENYKHFLDEIAQFIPEKRIYTDELRRLAWGTDAGFYRLIPKTVVRSMNESEVAAILKSADKYNLPVTFRAGGTSLSGQAISDSILVVAGKHWENYKVSDDYKQITLQPGLVGERVNQILKPFGVKFSPDPASVKYAMIGGIVMNNASGMNCGNHANSDKVLVSARMVFADGTVLDTGNDESKQQFAKNKSGFIAEIRNIKQLIYENEELLSKIKYKYSIKNVMGLNILPFVEYDDPFDIIAHLLVGSEGTLAFLSEITVNTEHDYRFKASAMLYFKNIQDATRAVVMFDSLNKIHGFRMVKGAELLDSKSLKSVGYTTDDNLTALLTEVKGDSSEEISEHINVIESALMDFDLATPVYFTDKVEEYSKYWEIRSGIFPSVGGTRPLGSSCLIEDVAFHIHDLPSAVADLQNLLVSHGYHDACIYGHSLQGNFHFILNQSFEKSSEAERYENMMNDVVRLVVDKYNGSLKAEHGTGRNMAPFVEYEWGSDVFSLMKRIKRLFDPKNLLNPGVIFNDDPKCHIKNLKPLSLIILKNGKKGHSADKCIECGFCEINCLSAGLTLSSRQRIVVQREISRLRQCGAEPKRLSELEKAYIYHGEQTCAVDGLCAISCPMGINTGDLTHDIRNANVETSKRTLQIGGFAAKHFSGVKTSLRAVLSIANVAHTTLGSGLTNKVGQSLVKIGMPLWSSSLPKAYKLKDRNISYFKADKKVVYFPSCINQTMGVARNAPDKQPLIHTLQKLLNKAGYEVIFPKEMDRLCCGTIWESKGMYDIAEMKTHELELALWEVSQQGKYPVICDQSPCLKRMRETIKGIELFEPAEFIHDFLLERLSFEQTNEAITVHVTCSMTKMGLGEKIIRLANLCSSNVLIPEEVGCCGFAGDRGFTYPELNEYALRKLKPQIQQKDIRVGYSNSRTCEIGLETNCGIPYESIVYLIDKCTSPVNIKR